VTMSESMYVCESYSWAICEELSEISSLQLGGLYTINLYVLQIAKNDFLLYCMFGL